MSEAAEVIARLRAAGVNYQTMGAALGRNRSTFSQVARGKKQGSNLVQSLRQLEERLGGLAERERANAELRAAEVAPPPKRQRAGGGEARVRRPATVQGRSGSYSTTTLKSQATGSGARSVPRVLKDAAENGQSVAVTVGVKGGTVTGSSPVHGNRAAGGRVGARPHQRGASKGTAYVEMNLGDAGDVLDRLGEHADFTALVMAEAREAGYVRGGRAVELEVRTF